MRKSQDNRRRERDVLDRKARAAHKAQRRQQQGSVPRNDEQEYRIR